MVKGTKKDSYSTIQNNSSSEMQYTDKMKLEVVKIKSLKLDSSKKH